MKSIFNLKKELCITEFDEMVIHAWGNSIFENLNVVRLKESHLEFFGENINILIFVPPELYEKLIIYLFA